MKTAQTWIGIAFFLLTVSLSGYGQKYQIEGNIRDSDTREPIPAASIILKNTASGTSSNENGKFTLTVFNFPAVLFIQCMGYVRDTLIISSEKQFNSDYKNRNREVFLKKNTFQINEVQVKARSILFEKDPYAIIDFKIVGRKIVALGYKNGNEFKKEILLADLSGKMLSNHTYKNLDSIYQDCQGNIFAFCKDSVLELGLARRQIRVQDTYSRNFISDYIVPVCGISDSMIFLKKSSVNHQNDNYFAVHDSSTAVVMYSTGGMIKEQQVASLRVLWDSQDSLWMTINDYPTDTNGRNRSYVQFMKFYEGLHLSYFETHYRLVFDYPPISTKMIQYEKNHLIFNRQAGTIFWFDEKGELTNEVGMITKMNGMYYKDVHLDPDTKKIYLEYPQRPFTHFIEINPESGQEIRRFMVRDFRHIEKCRFQNDRLYFLYQPDVGMRIKKVYSIWI